MQNVFGIPPWISFVFWLKMSIRNVQMTNKEDFSLGEMESTDSVQVQEICLTGHPYVKILIGNVQISDDPFFGAPLILMPFFSSLI